MSYFQRTEAVNAARKVSENAEDARRDASSAGEALAFGAIAVAFEEFAKYLEAQDDAPEDAA